MAASSWLVVALCALGAAPSPRPLRSKAARLPVQIQRHGSFAKLSKRGPISRRSSYEDILGMNPMRNSEPRQDTFAMAEAELGEVVEELPDDPRVDDAEGDLILRFKDAKGGDVVLLPMRQEHAQGYFREINENRGKLEVWLPSFRNAYRTMEDTQAILAKELEWMHSTKSFRWSIFLNGRIKGNVGLNVIDWEHKVGYLGYWLSEDARGRGIASMAVERICDLGFKQLGLDHMDISARKQNEKSAAIAKRLNFDKQDDIEDNEPRVKFPLDVYTLSNPEGTSRRVLDARQEFFLLNAQGYFGNPKPICFSLETKRMDKGGLFGKLFSGWG